MKKLSYSIRQVTGIALAVICFTTGSAHAVVIGSAVDNGNGTYTYSYTIDNTGGTFDTVAFSLEFSFLSSLIDWNQSDVAGGGDVVVPNLNWIAQAGVPTIGVSAQDFFSIDPSGDVLVGDSLSGFSFISALAPGVITYFFQYGAGGESASGNTVGPVPGGGNTGGGGGNNVPDAGSSAALLIASFSCVMGLGRWVRNIQR